MDIRDRLGIEHRVVQAALGDISGAGLAGAVSCAGGLGTVCTIRDPAAFQKELRLCRELCGRAPFSANLLFPSVRRAHVEICIAEKVPVVSLFFGFDAKVVRALREAGAFVLHQVGSAEQARRALADGADGLIAQGLGAGGHVLAERPLDGILAEVLAIAGDRAVLASGGIHDRPSAERAIALGASGVWAGTRFLMTHESNAHDAYCYRARSARALRATSVMGCAMAIMPCAADTRKTMAIA